jgi:hypothetical protein
MPASGSAFRGRCEMPQISFLRIKGPAPGDQEFVTLEHDDVIKLCQQEIGGYIEVILLEQGFIAIVNEDGKRLMLTPSVVWMSRGLVHDILVGTVIVLRSDMQSLQESDLPIIKRYLLPMTR